MKTQFIRGMSRFLLLAFIVLMVSMFFSCASTKHKETKKEEVKIELSENDKSKTETSKDTVSKQEVDTKKENSSKSTQTIYEGKKGDSLTVIEENLTTGEKKKTTYVGSGKLTESTKDNFSKEETKIKNENSKSETSIQENESNLKLEASLKKTETKKDKKTTFNWWWLLLLLIPFFYLNKKYRWFIRLKNYVTSFLK